MDKYASCVLKSAKQLELRYDLVQEKGDQVLNIPIVFPEGDDWQALMKNAARVNIMDVKVKVRPWDNMIIPNSTDAGYVSGDFPVYLVVYPGNTTKDDEGMTISTACINGDYASGTRTTAINGSFAKAVYRTLLDKDGDVVSKDKIITSIDCDIFKKDNNVYQSGKIVIGIKPEDFEIHESATSAGAIRQHLADKMRRYGKGASAEQKEQPMRKGSKKNPPPTPDYEGKAFVDEPVLGEDGKYHLYVKYPFWVETTTEVTYEVKSAAAN